MNQNLVEQDKEDEAKTFKMQYKKMDRCLYTVVTLLHFGFEMSVAIQVDDIGKVFNFIVTFGCCFLFFIMPSLMYFTAASTHPERVSDQATRLVSTVNLIFGLFVFSISLYSQYLSLK